MSRLNPFWARLHVFGSGNETIGGKGSKLTHSGNTFTNPSSTMILKKLSHSLALAGLLTAALAHHAFAGPFTLGNLVVVQVGDGSAAGGQGTLTPVELQEFTTTGSFVQSVALPVADSGSNYALTISRHTDIGALNRTVDGQYLVLGGTHSAPRTSLTDPVGRVIARVDADGNVDTSTRFTNAYGGTANNIRGIRSVVSVDGGSFWTSGDGTGDIGVRHIAFGGTASTAITATDVTTRHLTIFDGQLYNSNGTARPVGTGLPTVGPADQVQLPDLPFGPANSPVFFDLDPNVPGADTLYVGLESDLALAKFTFDGTTWNAATTYATSANLIGLIYLTGRLEEGKVALYATARTDSSNPAFGNSLVRLVDEGDEGYTFSTLAVASSNYTFRGIAFSPVPEPSTYVLAMLGVAGILAMRSRRRGRADV